MTETIPRYRPDRYEIREQPEAGILAAIYDQDQPDQPFCSIIRRDPNHPDPERCLLGDPQGQPLSLVEYEARRRQRKVYHALNDRFQVMESRGAAGPALRVEDRARLGPAGEICAIARVDETWKGWQVSFLTGNKPLVTEQHSAREAVHQLTEALNGRPAEPWAETWAARYRGNHPGPTPTSR